MKKYRKMKPFLGIMKYIPLVALSLLVPLLLKAQQHTSFFNNAWLKSVVSIEQVSSPTEPQPIGTGFIIHTDRNHFFLITARHVVLSNDGKFNSQLGWFLNEKTNSSDLILDSVTTAYLGSSWFISSNADLACRMITFANGSDIVGIPISAFLPQTNLDVAAHVLILGFPMGLRSQAYTTPIARSGIVARSDSDELTLDCFVFPGNSGGPVLYSPLIKVGPLFQNPVLNEERLIGVVTDYIPYTDVAYSPQTHRPRISFEENSGLCHAVSADQILALLHRPDVATVDSR